MFDQRTVSNQKQFAKINKLNNMNCIDSDEEIQEKYNTIELKDIDEYNKFNEERKKKSELKRKSKIIERDSLYMSDEENIENNWKEGEKENLDKPPSLYANEKIIEKNCKKAKNSQEDLNSDEAKERASMKLASYNIVSPAGIQNYYRNNKYNLKIFYKHFPIETRYNENKSIYEFGYSNDLSMNLYRNFQEKNYWSYYETNIINTKQKYLLNYIPKEL